MDTTIMNDARRDLALRNHLIEGRLELAVQQIVRARDARREPEWQEALLRPQLPNCSPLELVLFAERANMGAYLDQLVLERSLKWLSANPQVAHLSLNLTASSLVSPGLATTVLGRCDAFRVDPSRLVLEVSELFPIGDLEATRTNLLSLRKHGVDIALDDFGGGYAHLRLLMAGLVDVLKIDAGLVEEATAGADPGHAVQTLRSCVAFGHDMGLRVVIEGIATSREYNFARLCPGVYLQGHYMSVPRLMDARAIAAPAALTAA